MCDLSGIFGGAQTVPQQTAQFNQFGQAQNTTQNTTQAQQQVQEPNPWALGNVQRLYDQTNALLVGQQGPYPLQGIAPLSAQQLATLGDQGNWGTNVGANLIPQGEGFLSSGANMMQQAGQGITGQDVAGFYNPMAGNITANLQNVFNQQNLANRIGSTASTGGVGGDRAAVAQSLLAQKQGLAAGQVYSDLYQKSLQAAQQQKVQQLGAGAGVAGLGLPTIAAGFGGYGQALQAASIPQAQQQAGLSAEFARQQGQYQDPFLRQQALINAQGALGAGGGTTTQTGGGQTLGSGLQTGQGTSTGFGQITYPAPSIFGQLAGLGTAAVGAASLFSDKRAKTDVQKAGKDPGTGLPLYAYRYKGDPKTYPKVVGPMAQDVQKKYPGAVREMGGQPKGYQYGGEVDDEGGGDYGGDDYSVGYSSQDYYSGEDIGAPDTSANELYKGFTERQEMAKTAQKPWERAQKTLKAINMMRQGAGAMDANTNLKGPTFTTPPYMSKLGQPILPGMQEGGAVEPEEPEAEPEQKSQSDEETMRKRLQAVKLMQQGARGLETNTNLKGPVFPRPSYMGQLGRPFLPGTYQAGGGVRPFIPSNTPPPRAAPAAPLPVGGPGSPSQGIYPQALNAQTLFRNARGLRPPGRGYAPIRQEGGRVDARTQNDWAAHDREGPEYTRRRYGNWGQGVLEGEYEHRRTPGYFPREALQPAERPRMRMVPNEMIETYPSLRGELRRSYQSPNVYQEGGAVEAGDASGGTTAALPQVPLPQARPVDANTGFMGPLTSPMPHAVTGEGGIGATVAEGEPPPMEALTTPMPQAATGEGGIGLPEPVPLPLPRPAGLGVVPAGVGTGGGAPAVGGGGGLGGMGTSPALALLQAGLGMMAASGQRDARGLPMAPLAAIGQGGMKGVEVYQQQQQQALKDKLAREGLAFRQLQLAETLRHHKATEGNQLRLSRETMPRVIGRDADGLPVYGIFNPATQRWEPEQPTTTTAATAAATETETVGGRGESPLPNEPPEPAPVGSTSSGAIKLYGEQYAQTGKLPPGLFRQPSLRAAIVNYGDALGAARGLSRLEMAEMWRFAPRQAGWIMGQDGRTMGALGTLVDHLDTMKQLTTALKNGDNQTYNLIANKWAKWAGKEFPTNVEAGAGIVGAEIMKAVGAAGAGTGVEREAAGLSLADLAKSPKQFEGAIDVVQRLAAGQLRTKYRQGEAISMPKRRLDTMVGKRALDVLKSLDETTDAKPTPTENDRTWVREHPEDRGAFIKRFGVNP